MTRSATVSVVVRATSAKGGAKLRGKNRLGAALGVEVIPERVGKRAVTQAEMQQAVLALRQLPAADIALLAQHNIKIHLYPAAGLEDSLLGATTVIQNDQGRWEPTQIRIAARAKLTGAQAIGEIVQHESGHAISVLRKQDRSEAAAEAYARNH